MNIEQFSPIPFVGKWIDLTHVLMEDSLSWPGSPRFELEKLYDGYTDQGHYLNINLIKVFEQTGTHIEAPHFMFENGVDVSEVALSTLISEGIKIDIAHRAKENPNYALSEEDIIHWEQQHGTIPSKSTILIQTGYAHYWPSKEKYWGIKKGMEERQDNLHFPGIHPDAAKWLISKRSPIAIGIDTSSVDFGQAKSPLCRLAFLQNDISIYENINVMDALPETGFLVVALPVKIRGASSAPLRIVACIP